MELIKKHYKSKTFGPITGFRSGISVLYGPPYMTVWCFHVGDVLIDCGPRHLRAPLLNDFSRKPVSHVLVTHFHEDHSGNAAVIKKKFNARVYGHPKTAAKLKHSFSIRAYQHLAWRKSDPVEIEPLPAQLESGPYVFEPIFTPGHSKDHMAYLEKNNGWLFSGDLFVGVKIKFFRSDEVLEDQLNSLKTVLSYDFKDLYCGHRPTMGTGKDAIRKKLDFLENFYGSVKDLYARGLPRKEITRRLDPANDRGVKLITLNNASFSQMVRSAVRLARKELGNQH